MKRLGRYFFQGLIFLAPIAVTAYVFWALFSTVDGWLGLGVPGLGAVVVVVGVTAIGFLGNLFLLRPIVRLVERVLERLPFAKVVYGAVRDLLSAVVGEQRRFDKPVLVAVGEGVEVLGFLTRESLDELGVADRVSVYLPQSYNFAGQVLVVRRDRITPLPAAGGEAMTFVVSAGVAGPASGERAG